MKFKIFFNILDHELLNIICLRHQFKCILLNISPRKMQGLEIKLAFCFKFKKGDWFDKILTHRSTFQGFFFFKISRLGLLTLHLNRA